MDSQAFDFSDRCLIQHQWCRHGYFHYEDSRQCYSLWWGYLTEGNSKALTSNARSLSFSSEMSEFNLNVFLFLELATNFYPSWKKVMKTNYLVLSLSFSSFSSLDQCLKWALYLRKWQQPHQTYYYHQSEHSPPRPSLASNSVTFFS